MQQMQAANSESVVATIPAAPEQNVVLPVAGTYWVVAIGPPDALKAARQWTPRLLSVSTSDSGMVDMGDPERTSRRRDRGGLDLLFTMRVRESGTYLLSLGEIPQTQEPTWIRITRFSRAGAGIAMKSMASGVLFSILLLASAMVWFRRR